MRTTLKRMWIISDTGPEGSLYVISVRDLADQASIERHWAFIRELAEAEVNAQGPVENDEKRLGSTRIPSSKDEIGQTDPLRVFEPGLVGDALGEVHCLSTNAAQAIRVYRWWLDKIGPGTS